jgi:hypothetical protein
MLTKYGAANDVLGHWKLLARVLDRLLFCTFFIVTLTASIAIFVGSQSVN